MFMFLDSTFILENSIHDPIKILISFLIAVSFFYFIFSLISVDILLNFCKIQIDFY